MEILAESEPFFNLCLKWQWSDEITGTLHCRLCCKLNWQIKFDFNIVRVQLCRKKGCFIASWFNMLNIDDFIFLHMSRLKENVQKSVH